MRPSASSPWRDSRSRMPESSSATARSVPESHAPANTRPEVEPDTPIVNEAASVVPHERGYRPAQEPPQSPLQAAPAGVQTSDEAYPSYTRETVPSCRQKSQEVAFLKGRGGLLACRPRPRRLWRGLAWGGEKRPRMSRKLLNAAIAVALAAVAFVTFVLPASAEERTLSVRLANGSIITVKVSAPCGPIGGIGGLPGTPVADLTPPAVCDGGVPTTPTTPAPTT